MALAPGLMRRGGLFGAPSQTPATVTGGGGVFGGGRPPAAAAPAAPRKGFDWAKALGVLGDSLSILGGGQAQYVPNLMDQQNRQRAQAYAEQQYQRRRADENADWLRQEQWKRDNPMPINNDTVADYQFITQNLGEEAGKEFLRNKANPPQYRQGPDGQFYRIDVAPGQMPTFTQDDWDKAGQGGTSGTPAGGRF